MAAQSQTTVKALGLNINPNFLDLPNGSLIVANDVIIRRENVIESRRGLSDWSEGLGISTDRPSQLMQYKDRILTNYSSKLAYATGTQNTDGTEIFAEFDGSYTSASSYRMKYTEANRNLYFTTSDGIKKISANTSEDFTTAPGYIEDAGAVKAIDFTTTLEIIQGQTDGFLPVDSAVAYRTVWGYKDVNDNLILGAPSTRNVVYNYASNAFVMDFNKILTSLDLIGGTTGGGLITNTNYYSTLNLGLNEPGTSLKTNMVALCEAIDNDILLADDNAVPAAAPLTFGNITMNTAGVVAVTFSAGTATNYISNGDYVKFTGLGIVTDDLSVFNGPQQVTSVSAGQITFTYTFPANSTPYAISTPRAINAGSTLNSYNFTQIANTGDSNTFVNSLVETQISSPLTAGQMATITDTLNRVVVRLSQELTAVISSTLVAKYITPFNITESANVKLKISIPTDSQGNQLGGAYFLQVYRSNVFNAYNGSQADTLSLGVTVIPDDELRLVYEYFPTGSPAPAQPGTDYFNGYVEFQDTYPDELAQANTPLYTNPITGDGILQSNDIPPYANDISFFKNYTFYANTKTRHLIPNLQLIGVDNIVSGDKITIANKDTSSTYTFIDGAQQVTQFALSGAVLTGIGGKYFTLNNANDVNEYYCWYNVDQGSTNPLIANKIGIEISILSTDSIATVCQRSAEAISNVVYDFTATTLNNISNIVPGSPTTTITTQYPHELTTGNAIVISGVTQTGGTSINGSSVIVTVTGLNTFTIPTASIPTGVSFLNSNGSFSATIQMLDSFLVTNIDAGITTNAANVDVPATFTVTVNTPGTGENTSTNEVLISRTVSAAINIDLTARSFIRVINGDSNSPIYAYYTSGDNTSPGQIALVSKVLSDTPFYVIASGTQFNSGTPGIGTSFTPDISPIHVVPPLIGNIVDGPTGFVTFTTPTPHNLQNGFQVVITNTNCNPVLDGVYTVYNVTSTTFDILHIPVLVSDGTTFSWELTSDSVVSTNTVKPNRVYYSKFNQPDAVPLLNYFDIGPEDQEILRIFPLRTSLFVFKQDGLYRISGEIAPFTVQLFDSSCILIAPDTVDVADNIIFGWTTKGISNITESGTSEISKPVDIEILKLASYPNFKTITWGLGYNSDSSYTVYTNAIRTDDIATIGFRYSTLTNTWTNVVRSQTCGLIKLSNDLMYMGSGIDNIINQERKNFDRTDYTDKDFTLQIGPNAVNAVGTVVQFASVADIELGDVVYQEQYLSVYNFNALLQKLDLDPTIGDDDYFASLEASIGDNMRNKILALSLKLDSDPGLTQTTYNAHITDKTLNITNNTIANPTVVSVSSVSNLVDGRIVLISGTQSPSSIKEITGQYQISNTGTWGVSNTFTIPVNVTTNGGTGLVASTQSDNILDLQACFNALVTMVNNDPGATYSDYSTITYDTPMEAVVTSINRVAKTVTLNIAQQWIEGPVQIYKAIPCEVLYSPLTFGDVLKLKQVYESTVMFSNTAFSKAKVSFSSDLKPDFIAVNFSNYGNGVFGSYSNPGFGFGYFGGGGNAKPFRTLIPLQTQRCRFINIKFNHQIAREICELYGVTLTANIAESTRAYR
jgi:hypothetical protein